MGAEELRRSLDRYDEDKVHLLSVDFGSVRSLLYDPTISKRSKISKILSAFEQSNKRNAEQIIPYMVAHTKGAILDHRTYVSLLNLHDEICFFMECEPFIFSGQYAIIADCFYYLRSAVSYVSEAIPQDCRATEQVHWYHLAKFKDQYSSALALIEFVETFFDGLQLPMDRMDIHRMIDHRFEGVSGVYFDDRVLNLEFRKKTEKYPNIHTVLDFRKALNFYIDKFKEELKRDFPSREINQFVLPYYTDRTNKEHLKVVIDKDAYLPNEITAYDWQTKGSRDLVLSAILNENHPYHKYMIKSPHLQEVGEDFWDIYYLFRSVSGDSYLKAKKRKDDVSYLNWDSKLRMRNDFHYACEEDLLAIEKEISLQMEKVNAV